MSFLSRLGLPDNTTTATIRTKLNGKPLEWETKGEEVGGGAWTLGSEVVKDGKDFRWTTWTVENGCHVTNFDCTITAEGKLIKGIVNIFALGVMPLDQGYVDELLSEYDDDKPTWEFVKQ